MNQTEAANLRSKLERMAQQYKLERWYSGRWSKSQSSHHWAVWAI